MAKRGTRQCTICRHAERGRIERGLACGVSARAISQKFGVSHDAVGRHWRNHVAEETRSALVAGTLKAGVELERLVIEESSGVLEALQVVRAQAPCSRITL